MKVIFLILIFSFQSSAFAQSNLALLAKCRSIKEGVVFISFGHKMSSDSPTVEHFATDVIFAPTQDRPILHHNFLTDFEGALKETEVNVRTNSMTIDFPEQQALSKVRHRLTMVQNIKNIHGFIGNWGVYNSEGKLTATSEVSCTVPQAF